MLEKLGYEGHRIFEVDLSSEKKILTLTESGNLYERANLTRPEVIELAIDLLNIAAQMKD